MRNTRALILGNGKNRLTTNFPSDVDVWACNLAFKEPIEIDVLVATDAHRQHEIYTSGYAKENRCMFLDWVEIPAIEHMAEGLEKTGYKVTSNVFADTSMVISGWESTMFVTYLDLPDKVANIPMNDLPQRFSTGGLAMWEAAIYGYKQIYLAGFGDDKHAYREYKGGVDYPNTDYWKKEREFIMGEFPEILWSYI